MSYSNSFPQQRPTLNLDFANSGKLDSRLSYSRSSGGTYMSSEKALSSENLLKQSEDLGTTWSVFTDLSTPTGSQTSPSGDSTAWLLTATTDANASPALQQSTSTGAGTHTMVAHLKSGTASHGFISVRESNNNIAYAMVDFSAGTSTHGSYGSVTNPSSTVTALGSDWYRLTLTATVSSGVTLAFVGISDGTAVGSSGYDTGWNSTGQTMYAWGVQLSSTNSKVYDSPTTTQISRSYSPVLKTAAANEPRFEYAADGQSVGTPKGLLVESQSTNYMPNSNDFSTGWSNDNIDVTPSTAIAPNGTLSASLLRATGSTFHRIRRVVSVTSGQNYSASIYVKAAGYSHLFLTSGNTNTWSARAFFNLSNGTVGTVSNGTASIEEVGNGYYRCVINGTAGSSSGVYLEINVCEQDNATSYTSNDYGGLLAFGLQFEEGSASSLISTSGASATRAADSCSVDLNGILASGQDVTLYAEGDWGDYTVKPYNRFLATLSENTDPNWIALYNAGSSGASYIKYENNLEAVQTGVAANGNQKAAVSVAMNSINHAAAGVASAEDTSATVPPYTQLNIGNNRDAGTLSLNGHCTRVALYGQALSSSELAALTSS